MKTSPKPRAPGPRFVFFGGKGGVGKTTCASAFGVARARAGQSVLIVSTDPAHSLGDALGTRLGARPKTVTRNVDAVELDAPRAFARWIAEHRAAAADVLEHGTWLDPDDIDAILELPMPGVDELVALIEIDRVAGLTSRPRSAAAGATGAGPAYDLVVVDTAPTGHTLRLLAAPDAVRAVAEVLDAMQREHRLVREQLARVSRPEPADRLIDEIATQAAAVAQRLRDSGRTSFHWVTLAEAMSVAESEDALIALEHAAVRVPEIVVNRVLADEGPCPVCDRRRTEEALVLRDIRRTIGRGRRVRVLVELPTEPKGVRALAGLHERKSSRPPRHALRGTALSADERTHAFDPASLFGAARLVFVGGKGGVGKTTVAASVALALARARGPGRVLLLSTDPAHSLQDVFAPRGADAGRPVRSKPQIGDTPSPVSGAPANLRVREIDAAAALAARRRELDAAVADIAATLGAETTAQRDAAELMDLAPPGIDELFGMLSVFDARDEYDAIVIDMAPTGHALRLLELPGTAREWVQVLMRMLLKYRTLVKPGRLARELVEVSKSIRDFDATLRDPGSTRVLVVTRAAELPRRETERLLRSLERLRLSAPAILVNAMTLAPRGCRRCRRTMAAERKVLAALRRSAGRRSIIQTPLAAPAPRGARALDAWSRTWRRP